MPLAAKLSHSGALLINQATNVRFGAPAHDQHSASDDGVGRLKIVAFEVSVGEKRIGFFWLAIGLPDRAYEKCE